MGADDRNPGADPRVLSELLMRLFVQAGETASVDDLASPGGGQIAQWSGESRERAMGVVDLIGPLIKLFGSQKPNPGAHAGGHTSAREEFREVLRTILDADERTQNAWIVVLGTLELFVTRLKLDGPAADALREMAYMITLGKGPVEARIHCLGAIHLTAPFCTEPSRVRWLTREIARVAPQLASITEEEDFVAADLERYSPAPVSLRGEVGAEAILAGWIARVADALGFAIRSGESTEDFIENTASRLRSDWADYAKKYPNDLRVQLKRDARDVSPRRKNSPRRPRKPKK